MKDKKVARNEKFCLALMLFFALLTPGITLAQDTDGDLMPTPTKTPLAASCPIPWTPGWTMTRTA